VPGCDKTFTASANLSRHRKVHNVPKKPTGGYRGPPKTEFVKPVVKPVVFKTEKGNTMTYTIMEKLPLKLFSTEANAHKSFDMFERVAPATTTY